MTETMYSLKPVFELDSVVDVPSCMYSLPVIQCSVHILGVGAAAVGQTDDLRALEARQEAIIARLERLKADVEFYKHSLGLAASSVSGVSPAQVPGGRTADIVVRCSPSHPTWSVPGVARLLTRAGVSVHTSCHTHCSVASLPDQCHAFLPTTDVSRATAQVRITLIWKDVGRDCEMMVSPLTQTMVKGEVNVLRYLSRLFPSLLSYESLGNITAVDSMLDSVASLLWVPTKERQPLMRSLVNSLGRNQFLTGNALRIVDLALFSVIKQLKLEKELQPELAKWFASTEASLGGGQKEAKSPEKEMKKGSDNKKKGGKKTE